MFVHKEYKVNDITGDDVIEACTKCRKSVGGLDEWDPADMALLPPTTYRWIARLLNLIEEGAPLAQGDPAGQGSIPSQRPKQN